MRLYSISDLQNFSGVKAHTIRIWEQRYNALYPSRTDGNTRYYENSQLRRLLNIVSLMEFGYKPSILCVLSDAELITMLVNLKPEELPEDNAFTYFINQLFHAGISLDEVSFDKILSSCIYKYSLEKTYKFVIYPLIVKIGFMWATDSLMPTEEHFMTNLIRQKLYTAIDSLPVAKEGSESWLLFLPFDEYHEIGLLYANYLLKQQGKKVYYFGANLPLDALLKTAEKICPTNALLFIVHFSDTAKIQSYLDAIAQSNFIKKNIFISGNQKMLDNIDLSSKIVRVNTIEALKEYI